MKGWLRKKNVMGGWISRNRKCNLGNLDVFFFPHFWVRVETTWTPSIMSLSLISFLNQTKENTILLPLISHHSSISQLDKKIKKKIKHKGILHSAWKTLFTIFESPSPYVSYPLSNIDSRSINNKFPSFLFLFCFGHKRRFITKTNR